MEYFKYSNKNQELKLWYQNAFFYLLQVKLKIILKFEISITIIFTNQLVIILHKLYIIMNLLIYISYIFFPTTILIQSRSNARTPNIILF